MSVRNRNTPLRRFKYRALSLLPGQAGLRYARKYRKLFLPQIEAEFRAAIEASKGLVCIDLGANLGQHTRTMAAHAAQVYAFEPDPWTADQLRKNLGDLDNVEVIEAAAGTEDGTIQLFRTSDFDADPEVQSQSSSIVSDKLNVDADNSFDVKMIDFAAFISALDGRVGVVKMDIEGAEVALLEKLLEAPALQRIDHMYVETHETRVPSLASRTEALRRRVSEITHPKINMDWK